MDTFQQQLELLRALPETERGRIVDCALDLSGQMIDARIEERGLAPVGRMLGLTSLSQKSRYLRLGMQEELAVLVDALREARDAPLAEDAAARVLGAAEAIMVHLGCSERAASLRIAESLRLVNAVSVETVNGYRSFNLLQGDVLETASDLLVVSTHALPDRPPSGQALRRLALRWGIAIDPEKVHLRFGNWGFTCYESVAPPAPFRGVLTLRIDMQSRPAEPQALYDDAIRGLYASVAALEWLGHELPVISMPVLAGQSVVDYNAAAESLLRHAIAWLKRSQHAHTIQMVVQHTDEIAAWDRAMNECLGRSYVAAGQSVVLDSLCREITHVARKCETGPLAKSIRPLLDAMSNQDQICIENVCVFGRMLAEQMSSSLVNTHRLKQSPILMNNIEELRKAGVAAPWIISYMHSLRIFGNETVHARDEAPSYRPVSLSGTDLVSALSAIRALLTYWSEHV